MGHSTRTATGGWIPKKGIKACETDKIIYECVESINANCATEMARRGLYQRRCDQEKRTP